MNAKWRNTYAEEASDVFLKITHSFNLSCNLTLGLDHGDIHLPISVINSLQIVHCGIICNSKSLGKCQVLPVGSS